MEFIGIIGAMEEEVLALKQKMNIQEVRSIASLDFVIGFLNEKKIVVVRAGIGKVNAAVCTQILIDVFCVDTIINIGVAGAIQPQLEIADIVISKDAIEHDFDARNFGYEVGQIPRMENSIFALDPHLIKLAYDAGNVLDSKVNIYVERIVSGDQFVASESKKEYLRDKFGAYCTEMEGAAIAHVCELNQVPCVIIRAISDKADSSADVNFNEFVKVAASNSSKMIENMLKVL